MNDIFPRSCTTGKRFIDLALLVLFCVLSFVTLTGESDVLFLVPLPTPLISERFFDEDLLKLAFDFLPLLLPDSCRGRITYFFSSTPHEVASCSCSTTFFFFRSFSAFNFANSSSTDLSTVICSSSLSISSLLEV